MFQAVLAEAKYNANGEFIIKLIVPNRVDTYEAEKIGHAFGLMLTCGIYRKRYADKHKDEVESDG